MVGVLCALGLTSDLAGPVGSGLADATGAIFGRGRVAVPIACFVFAVLLLWPHRLAARERDDLDGDDVDTEPVAPRSRPSVSPSVRSSCSSPTSGSCTSPTGGPSIDGGLDGLRGAGGFIGAVVGGPLAAAAGDVGSTVVLGGLAVVGPAPRGRACRSGWS